MTQIEKVARASFACWRKRMDELGHHLDMGHAFEDMTESEMEFAFLKARAMIEAMRDPSPGMIKEAEECFFEWLPSTRWTITMAKEAYIAAIDAALKEE